MYKYYTPVFVCLTVMLMSTFAANVRTVQKRNDIDLQTCIDNFDIHKDKIIRTQDSKNMGAKYLNEIDLGSREECLRLCCETEFCDVFVFEEKSPGSCYLFQCGPPEDFKCKFTQHANYSSAVLAVNRHLNELENQIKLTKHEQDLARLRKPEDRRLTDGSSRADSLKVSTPAPTTSTNQPREVLFPMVTKAPVTPERRCSRYQFECRSSGECIAIYNACDGIPQCSDGSDEAPELECPDIVTTSVPTPPPPQPAIPNLPYNQPPNQLRKSLQQLSLENTYQSPPVQSSSRVQPPVESRESADFLRPIVDNRMTGARQQPAYGDPSLMHVPPPQPPYDITRSAQPNNWSPNQPNQIGVIAPNSQYPEKNSHIFNHKDSGLQMVESPESAAVAPYGDVNTRNEYPKLSNYYNDIYRPQYPVADNWQLNRPALRGEANPYVLNDNWQAPQIPPNQNVNDQAGQMYKPNIDVKQSWKSDLLETQVNDKSYDHTIIREPKLQEELIQQKELHRKTKIEETVIPSKKLENQHHKDGHVHSNVISAEELKQDIEDLYDGKADRPGGAILSLTLGVCLMCVMAILIGCKVRVVRRRMRRGGKSPYAHDADYLVNGMYL